MLDADILALQRVAAKFQAASPEDQAALLHIMGRLADAAAATEAESARVLVEAARETGRENLIRKAEALFVRFTH